MPLVNLLFWFLLAVLAFFAYRMLARLKKQEAADLLQLARLAEAWQKQQELSLAPGRKSVIYDLPQAGDKAAG